MSDCNDSAQQAADHFRRQSVCDGPHKWGSWNKWLKGRRCNRCGIIQDEAV